MNEFWRDVSPEQRESSLQNITMKFDLKNNKVELQSDAKSTNGAPLFDWKLDANTGEIVEATRQIDSASERIIERSVNPATLINEEVQKALALIEQNKPAVLKQDTVAVAVPVEASSTEQSAAAVDWDSLDMQRDIAFKIVYFFIVFIIATFGLLYAYFQMNKKEMEEE
jgi:hypothetical protein